MSVDDFISSVLDSWQSLLVWLVCFLAAFSLLGRLTPCNPGQPIWRRDAITDLSYSFIIPVFTRFVHVLFLSAGVAIFFYGSSEEDIKHYLTYGYGWPGSQPLWLQAALYMLISDVVLYWMHRMFHGRRLWRFHAIHHSSPVVDWMSAYRFHPINSWFCFTLVDTLTVLVGFSPAAIGTMAAFNAIYSAMVHANLNWTFGPFKHLFSSPVFHRWHHTAQAEGMDKNFAPTFPLIDHVFGTFYMPEGRVPETYGVPGSDIPQSFLGQLIWPFKRQ